MTMRLSWFMAASYTLSRALTAQAEQCDFCPRGDITEPDKPVAIPGFEFLDSCGKVDSIVKDIFTSDAAECIQLQDLLGTYCGCPPPENACTLCPDGSPVPDEYLSKELPWLATAFGGTAPTCEFLEAYVTTNESGDEGCTSLQITSASCGCPALPDHCVYCPGETLQEEYSQKVLPFVGNPDLGVTGTCEIYWYTQYQISQDDIRCDHSSVLTFHCGCNDGILGSWGATTEEQQIAMLWIPRIVGSFSLIAASMVLRHILTDQKKRASMYHQMVFMIAIFDIVTALVFIVGAAAVEEMNPETGLTHGIYGAYGNDTSCKASGFFYQLGFTSVFFNVSLTVYFLFAIVYGFRETKLRKLRVWLYGPPLVLGFGLAFAALPFILVSWNHCQADNNSFGNTMWSLLLFLFIPILGATTIIIALLLIVYLKVRKQLKKTNAIRLQAYQDRSNDMTIGGRRESMISRRSSVKESLRRDSLEGEVFWVCVSYATAFGISWPILMLGQFKGVNFAYPFWFWVIVVVVSPAQGLSNAYCYFRPYIRKRMRANRRARAAAAEAAAEEDEPLSGHRILSHCCSCICCNACSKETALSAESSREVVDPTDALANLGPSNPVQRRTVDEEFLGEVDHLAESTYEDQSGVVG